MTDILIPSYVWDTLVKGLSGNLNGPFFEPDGGITWDDGSSIVLALYKEEEK